MPVPAHDNGFRLVAGVHVSDTFSPGIARIKPCAIFFPEPMEFGPDGVRSKAMADAGSPDPERG